MEKTERLLGEGLNILQYRAKHKGLAVMVKEIEGLKKLCDLYNVPLIVNDHVDLALKLGCDGVHVGREDCGIEDFANRTEDGFIIGATAKTVEEALNAEMNGATYLGLGAMFPSTTKPDAIPMTIAMLERIKWFSTIPVYAIGGLTHGNISRELILAVDGVVLSSELYENTDNLKKLQKKNQSNFERNLKMREYSTQMEAARKGIVTDKN